MARFDKETVSRWTAQVDAWMSENWQGMTRDGVQFARDAWTVAHRSGVTDEAYRDRSVTDAHIQTALAKIFPNIVFPKSPY